MSTASQSPSVKDGESTMSPSNRERVTFDDEAQQQQQDRETSSEARQNEGVQEGAASVASSWAPQRPTGTAAYSDVASGSMSSTIPSRARRKQPKFKQDRRKEKKKADEPSLAERLGNSALSSTLEILKLAGGVSLNTTRTILSPSLDLTRNYLIPQLFAGIADYLNNISPQRLKDWFRIVSASVHHLIAVIVSTERGSVFRHKVVRVGGDIVDVASSDMARQALMDWMACFVKLNEALHTPEFKAFLEQLSIWGCRMVDVAANGKNKTLVHDVLDLAWSGVELANDPATTVAFAEVAAYLCYALEMEDTAIYAVAKERSEINQTAAQKRHERDEYQTATYQEPYLVNDPNATVEEVILSAFGVIQKSVEEANRKQAGDFNNNSDDIPGSVVLGSDDDEESERTPPPPPPTQTSTERATAGGGLQANDDYEDVLGEKPAVIGDHNADVRLLRDKITKHSENQRQKYLKTDAKENTLLKPSRKMPSNRQASEITETDGFDDGKRDIEDLSSLLNQEEDLKRQSSPPLQFEKNDNEPPEDGAGDDESSPDQATTTAGRPDRTLPLEGETPVAHFYRVLEQVLTTERERTALKFLPGVDTVGLESEANVLKRRVQEIRSEKRAPTSSIGATGLHPKIERFVNENELAVCAAIFFLMALVMMFCAFGCYGMYVFAFPPELSYVARPGNHGFGASSIHVPIVIDDNTPSSRRNKDEYVIKVIREVVHVDSKGQVLQVQKHSNDEL